MASAEKVLRNATKDIQARAKAENWSEAVTCVRLAHEQAKHGATKEAVDNYMRAAQLHAEAGFQAKVAAVLRDALRIQPDHAAAQELLSRAEAALGGYSPAAKPAEPAKPRNRTSPGMKIPAPPSPPAVSPRVAAKPPPIPADAMRRTNPGMNAFVAPGLRAPAAAVRPPSMTNLPVVTGVALCPPPIPDGDQWADLPAPQAPPKTRRKSSTTVPEQPAQSPYVPAPTPPPPPPPPPALLASASPPAASRRRRTLEMKAVEAPPADASAPAAKGNGMTYVMTGGSAFSDEMPGEPPARRPRRKSGTFKSVHAETPKANDDAFHVTVVPEGRKP